MCVVSACILYRATRRKTLTLPAKVCYNYIILQCILLMRHATRTHHNNILYFWKCLWGITFCCLLFWWEFAKITSAKIFSTYQYKMIAFNIYKPQTSLFTANRKIYVRNCAMDSTCIHCFAQLLFPGLWVTSGR